VQNLRRGHYDIATGVPGHYRLRIAFGDLVTTIDPRTVQTGGGLAARRVIWMMAAIWTMAAWWPGRRS
jgi:hypothetical protein